MNEIELKPGYSTVEIPGKCLKCLAEQEYGNCLKGLLKELIASPGHQPGLLPVWLAEEGVSVIIAGGMGSRAQSLFAENHIEVVIGTLEDNPEKAVLDYIGGKLVTGNNICDH